MAAIKVRPGDRQAVRFIVDRLHVGVADADVEAEIRERAARSSVAAPRQYIDALVLLALCVHHENQRLYNTVMGGL